MKKVGLIGFGKRMQEIYLPVFESLPNLSISAVLTETNSKRELIKKSGYLHYTNTQTFLRENDFDFLVVAIPAKHLLRTLKRLMLFDKDIFIETPPGKSLIGAIQVASQVRRLNLNVMALEQYPFFPQEEFKLKVVSSGDLGKVHTVENFHRYFSYHAFAALRTLLGEDELPERIIATKEGEKLLLHAFYDEKKFIHEFDYNFKNDPKNIDALDIIVHGENGSIDRNGIHLKDGDHGVDLSFDALEPAQEKSLVFKDLSVQIDHSSLNLTGYTYFQIFSKYLSNDRSSVYPFEQAFYDFFLAKMAGISAKLGGLPLFPRFFYKILRIFFI